MLCEVYSHSLPKPRSSLSLPSHGLPPLGTGWGRAMVMEGILMDRPVHAAGSCLSGKPACSISRFCADCWEILLSFLKTCLPDTSSSNERGGEEGACDPKELNCVEHLPCARNTGLGLFIHWSPGIWNIFSDFRPTAHAQLLLTCTPAVPHPRLCHCTVIVCCSSFPVVGAALLSIETQSCSRLPNLAEALALSRHLMLVS